MPAYVETEVEGCAHAAGASGELVDDSTSTLHRRIITSMQDAESRNLAVSKEKLKELGPQVLAFAESLEARTRQRIAVAHSRYRRLWYELLDLAAIVLQVKGHDEEDAYLIAETELEPMRMLLEANKARFIGQEHQNYVARLTGLFK